MRISVREARLGDGDDARALVDLIDSYAATGGGQNAPLTQAARERIAGFGPEQAAPLFLSKRLDSVGGRAHS